MALNSLRKQLQPVGTNLSVLRLDGIDWKALKFPNEESYRGGWKDSRVSGRRRLQGPHWRQRRRQRWRGALPPAPPATCCHLPVGACSVRVVRLQLGLQ